MSFIKFPDMYEDDNESSTSNPAFVHYTINDCLILVKSFLICLNSSFDIPSLAERYLLFADIYYPYLAWSMIIPLVVKEDILTRL